MSIPTTPHHSKPLPSTLHQISFLPGPSDAPGPEEIVIRTVSNIEVPHTLPSRLSARTFYPKAMKYQSKGTSLLYLLVVPVGGTRCVTSSTDHNTNIHARITLNVVYCTCWLYSLCHFQYRQQYEHTCSYHFECCMYTCIFFYVGLMCQYKYEYDQY
jgi:hypothetical protein